MRVVRYVPELFPSLRALTTPRSGLSHQPFVDHYYCSRPACQLHLLFDKDGTTIGSIGIERMPFEYRGQRQEIAFASNLIALAPGAGGVLYLTWVKSSPVSMVFGGSPDTHRILRAQKWTYYPGVLTWRANRRYSPHSDESFARRLAQRVLRATGRKIDVKGRGAQWFPAALEVQEQRDYHDELSALPRDGMVRGVMMPDYGRLRDQARACRRESA